MKISALVCTLNEASCISSRLENLCAQQAPKDVDFHIHILDNGSSDRTVEIANSAIQAPPFPITIHILPPIGKCAAIFWAFQNLDAEYFILTDANTVFSPIVLQEFFFNIIAAPSKGLRIGNTRNVVTDQQGLTFLVSDAPMPTRMRGEEFLGITTGANGACYCVSRQSVSGIWRHPPVRNDDFVISIYAAAKNGFSFVQDARAYEAENLSFQQIWLQKYRDALGHNQAIAWVLRAVTTAGARQAVALRLAYWLAPFVIALAGLWLLHWYFLALTTLLIFVSRKMRLAAARYAALAAGYLVGAFHPPAPKWLPQR